MLDAILEQAKENQLLEAPERLSDMLAWLSKRGFSVSICIDKSRLEEPGVRQFANRLIKNNCKVYSKELSGLMHKKAFVTPLGAIEGSANLTQGGTGSNEEIVNYAQFSSQAYNEIAVAVKDTFYGAIPSPASG
jgi:phosphatidylserine/phosphatidylglycerophosphate/cardiolipin synthase-like enzyme